MSNIAIIDTNMFDIGIKKRISKSGPELDLVNNFIEISTKDFEHEVNKLAVFMEPLVDTFYPDIVFAEYDPKILDEWKPARNVINTKDIKILENIRAMNGTNSKDIVSKTSFLYKDIMKAVERLLDAELLCREDGQWKAKSISETYFIKRLVSIEAKINNWKTLLKQANTNKWFASESYALTPIKKPMQNTIQPFKDYGIGVYSLTNNEIVELNKASKQPLPTSYMSWMFNEWVGRYMTCHQ
ncbi:MAG: hypothetical protein LBB59_04675 [Campylobacteraceae bacterium]|nr:hypothetical protein [Campylobacteraceae bacterium]